MIVIGSTTAAWKVESGGVTGWLENAEALRDSVTEEVRFFLALEVDARGEKPLESLLSRLKEVDGVSWAFSLDDGSTAIDTGNRLVRICTGRNLIREYAMRTGATAILHLDSDGQYPPDTLKKLLEVDYPIVAGQTPKYSHIFEAGPTDLFDPRCKVNWASAACLLVRREAFKKLLWGTDPDDNLSDDPFYNRSAVELGILETRVRQDVIYNHESLRPVEARPGDRKIYRDVPEEPVAISIPTVVVIPTIRQYEALSELVLRDLSPDKSIDYIYLLDNGHDAKGKRVLREIAGYDSRVIIQRVDGGIYHLWQYGVDRALDEVANGGEVNVLMLNDDVRLPFPGTAQVLAERLRADWTLWLTYPDYGTPADSIPRDSVMYTEGTFRKGGMSGWCFMLKGEAQPIGGLPKLDAVPYEWWLGDDELALQIKRRGYRQGRVLGLPCLHQNEATASLPEFEQKTSAAKERDIELFKSRWSGEW